jgi:type IV pilus assembly protein PilP
MSRRILIPILACLGLAACSGEQYSDLRQFVKDQENLPHGRIPPLPDVKPYEPFTYDAYNLVDPFKPRKIEPPKNSAAGGKQPDLNRRKEPLEAYPLENLRMVGTLQQNKATYALVKSPDNNLFRVKAGNQGNCTRQRRRMDGSNQHFDAGRRCGQMNGGNCDRNLCVSGQPKNQEAL